MKINMLVFVFSFLFSSVIALQDSLPVYKRFPTLPPFNIVKLPDGSSFKKENLRKKTNTLIMIFCPDCAHCINATKDLLANDALFKSTQIVMVSSMPFYRIKYFYSQYQIASYPNIIAGWDFSNF